MHLCSALCAAGSGDCCGKEDNDNDHCEKACCNDEKGKDEKKPDCQDLHFSFFKTTGQFQSDKTVEAIKLFPSFIALIPPVLIFQLVSQNKDVFAYNGFHPPPPKADIRIFIQSFLI